MVNWNTDGTSEKHQELNKQLLDLGSIPEWRAAVSNGHLMGLVGPNTVEHVFP